MNSFFDSTAIFSKRGMFLALLNLLFFGGVFAVVTVSEWLFPPSLDLNVRAPFLEAFFNGDFYVSAFAIFIFNLAWSVFVFILIPGFFFFPLSITSLFFRAFIWGSLLYSQPTWILLVAIPTVILEGEGCVLAAFAGTLAGASWVKPEWVYCGESLGRREAFGRSLSECSAVYALVIVLILAGAVVETATLMVI